MKRRLIILRHAKSDWASGATSDHARPLNKRGRRTAPHVGETLEGLGWVPDLILSSDSLRTRMTVQGVLEGLSVAPPPAQFTRHLYHAGVDDVRRELPTVDAALETVLLVGHNPGWESMVAWLSGRHVIMKTSDFALLEGGGSTWGDAVAEPHAWKLMQFLKGRDIAG
ncbi:MAG: histidine phosphatase family protein [Proteobacteria bacterium]|nr:histidine phosphatase family protein [Pseudomonadota bacterium]